MIQLVPNQLIRGFVSQQSDPTLRGWVSRSDEISGRTFFPRKSNEHCWTSLLPPTPWHLRPNKVLGSETAIWLFLGHCCLFLVIWVVIQYIGHWHPPTPVEYFIELFSSWSRPWYPDPRLHGVQEEEGADWRPSVSMRVHGLETWLEAAMQGKVLAHQWVWRVCW